MVSVLVANVNLTALNNGCYWVLITPVLQRAEKQQIFQAIGGCHNIESVLVKQI